MNMQMAKPLFIFEMANNHMGDLEHGIRIIREFKKVIEGFNQFDFSIKLQLRDDSFFHPDHINRQDHKLIKRFVETRLSRENFKRLADEIKSNGFLSMCTPWDEPSVDRMEELGFDIFKIASCSFNDWPLLERVVKVNKMIIASTAGAQLDEIDQVVSFFSHRDKKFAIMHCVGEYPCPTEHLELNQIEFFRNRYKSVPIGFSTHEDPNYVDSILVAIAQGAIVFEKHVGVPTDKYALNAYSINPQQARKWLEKAAETYRMCGVKGIRRSFTKKEMDDLGILYRGAYAIKDIPKGTKIDLKNTFLAMPNIEGQIVARQFSKYTEFYAERDFKKNEPLMMNGVTVRELRHKVTEIINKLRKMLKDSRVILPPYVDIEISYHKGIDRFNECGAILIKVLNREYSKILLVMFPGQSYPLHRHVQKDETYHILHGDLTVKLDGQEYALKTGELLSVGRGKSHSFSTNGGVIIEEIATAYIVGDSVYEDRSIVENQNRKTLLTFWPDWMED